MFSGLSRWEDGRVSGIRGFLALGVLGLGVEIQVIGFLGEHYVELLVWGFLGVRQSA